MKITVHRGSNQIGGCVTEYESNGWKLFVDYGEQLPGAPFSDKKLEIDGLTYGDIHKSALLITHNHGDHIGKITELPLELPIYMGKTAKEVALKYAEHMSGVNEKQHKMSERLKSVSTFSAGVHFSFGDFDVLPLTIDHSAFDAYAFCIKEKELKVFHTGDFRTHGFRSGKLPMIIERYVGRVDYVVCEATNVNRPNATNMSEPELQREFKEAFKKNKYNVVYVSSTNIDRLFSLYHAAVNAGRPFYVDGYQKKIMDIAQRDPIWGKSPLYQYMKVWTPTEPNKDNNEFYVNNKFINFVSERGYVIVARQGKKFDDLLSKLPANGRVKYLSMWSGYLDPSLEAYNPGLAKTIGKEYRYMHTSGHCDMKGLEELVSMLQPKAVIPIHTDNPTAFADLFRDKWPVTLLKDGESFTAVHIK